MFNDANWRLDAIDQGVTKGFLLGLLAGIWAVAGSAGFSSAIETAAYALLAVITATFYGVIVGVVSGVIANFPFRRAGELLTIVQYFAAPLLVGAVAFVACTLTLRASGSPVLLYLLTATNKFACLWLLLWGTVATLGLVVSLLPRWIDD